MGELSPQNFRSFGSSTPGKFPFRPKGVSPQDFKQKPVLPVPEGEKPTTSNPHIDRLSKDLNIPVDIIKQDVKKYEQIWIDREAEKSLQASPETDAFIKEYRDRTNFSQEDIQSLSDIELLGNQFSRGQLLNRLGEAGSAARASGNTSSAEIEAIQERISRLGHDADGLMGYLGSASEVLGQNYEMITDPDFAVGVVGGAGIGAALGAAGGPLAPVTVPAGAAAGAAAGGVSAMFHNAFQVEGGLAYLDMVEQGVDPDTAEWLSYGVGILNAGLEIAGMTTVAAPVVQSIKGLIRKELRERLINRPAMRLVGGFAKSYGGAVAGETATESVQELVNIAAEEYGKQLSDIPSDITTEEVMDRVSQVADKTFKAMVVLGLPGSTVGVVSDAKQIRRARQNQIITDTIHEKIKEASLINQDPEVQAEHTAQILESSGHGEVFIPGDRIREWVQGDPVLIQNLGISEQLDEAVAIGGDVRIGAKQFAQHILQSERYNEISEHIRYEQDGLTAFEANELEESGLVEDERLREIEELDEAQVEEAVNQAPDNPTAAVDIAEFEAGLQGLFTSANEAGMTENQYANYLKSIETANEQAKNKQKDKLLKQEQQKLTKQWKQELEKVREEVREQLSNTQVYQAFNAIQRDRLDRAQVEAAIAEHEDLGLTLEDLPKSGRSRIYTPKDQEGISPELHAELHGYKSAAEMLLDFATTVPFNEAIEQNANRIMDKRHATIKNKKEAIIEARRTLHEIDYSGVLSKELNSLRKLRGQRKLSPTALKAAAKKRIGQYRIRDIKTHKFQAAERRHGRRAGVELRKGNIEAAADHKFKQLMNYHMAAEAQRVFGLVEKRAKQMRNWGKKKKGKKGKQANKLPVQYQEAIREVLAMINLRPDIPLSKQRDAVNKVSNAVDAPNIPDEYKNESFVKDYRDMQLDTFTTVYQTVRDIRHKGLTENKMRRAQEQQTLDENALTLSELIVKNLPRIPPAEERNFWQKAKAWGSYAVLLTFNTDTILRQIDNFEELGPAYDMIKGRYDRAMSRGYRPEQKGYIRRQIDEAENLKNLWETYSKEELKDFDKRTKIPGTDRRISKRKMLAIMMNMGNAQNIEALMEGNKYTQEELDAIRDFATEKDWNFVQEIWDYLESFWPEIKETEQRRRNYTPEKVEAQPIETQYGIFRGGYFPLRYNRQESMIPTEKDIGELFNKARYGLFATSQTKRGHTETRAKHRKSPVLLDPFVVNAHVDQVIYDLEVGDAVTDIFKILNHEQVRESFQQTGHEHRLEQLELWLRDVATAEIRDSNLVERGFRWLRTGFTVSKLAWNVSVGLIQWLGLSQTYVQIGHQHMGWALKTVLTDLSKHTPENENSIFSYVKNQTGFMRGRSVSFNKDIADAQRTLKLTILEKHTPGKTADLLRDSFFWHIKAMQGFVDTVTWLAANRQGLEQFNGDVQKAQDHADRMVARSQASGVFGERTPFERGSFAKNFRQSELVRTFSTFLSYFAAKWNVTVERTQKTKFSIRHPAEAIKWALDMTMLYTVEGMIYLFIKGEWPDEDDDETVFSAAAKESGRALLAGIPLARELSSEVQGFRGGGVVGNVIGDFGKAMNQWWDLGTDDGEIDETFIRATNNLFGTLLHYPSAQINKTFSTFIRHRNNEDIRAIDWIMGPKFEED